MQVHLRAAGGVGAQAEPGGHRGLAVQTTEREEARAGSARQHEGVFHGALTAPCAEQRRAGSDSVFCVLCAGDDSGPDGAREDHTAEMSAVL